MNKSNLEKAMEENHQVFITAETSEEQLQAYQTGLELSAKYYEMTGHFYHRRNK